MIATRVLCRPGLYWIERVGSWNGRESITEFLRSERTHRVKAVLIPVDEEAFAWTHGASKVKVKAWRLRPLTG